MHLEGAVVFHDERLVLVKVKRQEKIILGITFHPLKKQIILNKSYLIKCAGGATAEHPAPTVIPARHVVPFHDVSPLRDGAANVH